jgi:hydroxymethylpyrimidine pyrophosphatase-like HAD family hydrolase
MRYIFDVDGVLCDTGQTIDTEFHDWFVEWSKDKEYYIITGGERKSTIKQVGSKIVRNAKTQFHCMGNHIFIEGRGYKINQFTLHTEEYNWLYRFIQESHYHTKTGKHIEQRTGSLNVSVVGRNADTKQRNDYIEWDNIYHERERLADEFVKQFPRFQAYLGGNTSIDICLRGANKAQCVYLGDELYRDSCFFGDKCMPGGIDAPLRRHIHPDWYFQINGGYKETWEKLKSL